jgi:hypothetical protein
MSNTLEQRKISMVVLLHHALPNWAEGRAAAKINLQRYRTVCTNINILSWHKEFDTGTTDITPV